MSTAQWILNLALLGWVLSRNLGTRSVTASTFLVPAAVVVVTGAAFLNDLPTEGHDGVLELVGVVAGLLLGLFSVTLTRVQAGPPAQVTAGVAFAGLWLVVIGGRVAFAEWATHSGARTIGEFSLRHQITGADAWTASFVLMALTMVISRYAATAAMVALARRVPGDALPTA